MRIALLTNIPSHYQHALAQAFADRLKEDFSLVCWESVPEEQRKLGWRDNYEQGWLIKAWDSADEKARAIQILQSADVVIFGAGPISELGKRVSVGKLTFRYTERPFKNGRWRLLDPRVFQALWQQYRFSNRENYHLLSVGPYCADDFRMMGAFQGRMWRWGYFPEFPQNIHVRQARDTVLCLWAGRMLSWKRVDRLLHAAAWAQAQGGRSFELMLIGFGQEEEQLRTLAMNLGLSGICKFLGPQNPEVIGRAMEEADIYMFPSNKQEGWGVVVNEAMSRGCCVLGSRSAGAVPWLIRHGFNGLVFDEQDRHEFGRMLRWCIDNPKQRCEMGISARATISELWTPAMASERFLQLCDAIERRLEPPFLDDGPCSPVFPSRFSGSISSHHAGKRR